MGVLALVGGTLVLTSPGARATAVTSFTVRARADALAVQVIDPAAPLFPAGEITYATPATAQAVVDSVGESTAFASSPYPGDALAGLPSLVNGFAGNGGFPPLPAYPFLAASSYPRTPTSDQTQGPYRISATSAPTTSTGSAQIGVLTAPAIAAVRATATATVDPATGRMTALANDTIDALAIGPLLTIGDVSAYARVVSTPGQAPLKQTSFSVGTITIGGVTVGFTDKGLQVGTGTVPGVSPDALNALLRSAGVTLTYLPAVQTPTSIESAGLAVTWARAVPSQGVVTVTITLGRVLVQTTYASGGSDASGSTSPLPPAPPPRSLASAPDRLPSLITPAAPAGPTPSAPTLVPGRPAAVSALATPFVGRLSRWVFLVLLGAGVAFVLAASWTDRTRRPTSPPVLRLPPS